jgi:hypothetical protein
MQIKYTLSVPRYKVHSFFLQKQNKIESILRYTTHLDNVFTDLIIFYYLMQTPLLSMSIAKGNPSKPGIIFRPGVFFSFYAKNYTPYI